MSDEDRLRQRLAAAGASIPEEILGLVLATAGPLVTAIERLAALDLGDTEPFVPARRLPDDAAP
jgi:hypothetical protein